MSSESAEVTEFDQCVHPIGAAWCDGIKHGDLATSCVLSVLEFPERPIARRKGAEGIGELSIDDVNSLERVDRPPGPGDGGERAAQRDAPNGETELIPPPHTENRRVHAPAERTEGARVGATILTSISRSPLEGRLAVVLQYESGTGLAAVTVTKPAATPMVTRMRLIVLRFMMAFSSG